MRGIQSVPKIRGGPTSLPRVPQIIPTKEEFAGEWDNPPPGFITGQNSLTEWYVYNASFKVLGQRTDDPRRPPFYGLPGKFAYQTAELGGYVRALGSAVVDFLYFVGPEMIACRVQTEFWHLFTDAKKQGSDEIQRIQLERKGIRVYDLYDQDVLGDPSGQKACIAVKHVLGMIERPNPLRAGTAIRATRLKVIS